MKKLLAITAALSVWGFSASAQMGDMLGTLAIDGQLSAGGYQAAGQGRAALNRMQFQSDLSSLIAEVQMTFMGNYQGLSKNALSFNGFQGMDWNIGSENGSEFYVEFSGLDGATCFLTKGNGWNARRVEIDNDNCAAVGNHVKMFF